MRETEDSLEEQASRDDNVLQASGTDWLPTKPCSRGFGESLGGTPQAGITKALVALIAIRDTPAQLLDHVWAETQLEWGRSPSNPQRMGALVVRRPPVATQTQLKKA